MATHKKLQQFIKNQLNSLKIENNHHSFEHICRHIARLRICSNILPATGPVGAGGDQGRDFETYQTYLNTTPITGSVFLALKNENKLVFACSLAAKILEKIKDDLKVIFETKEIIDTVYYFCVEAIAVGNRHKLQKISKEKYNTHLEIFDILSISEMLMDKELFWIADEYLDVPEDYFPKLKPSASEYKAYKNRWKDEPSQPQSYSDFFQIKYCLRTSTFNANERSDISFWIKKMEWFLLPECSLTLRRKATYEIAVAALRGQNNLTAQRERIKIYFSELNLFERLSEIEEAVFLLMYCVTAHK